MFIILKLMSNHVFSFEDDWCEDEKKCYTMNETDCSKDWMQLNCPKRCGICGGTKDFS